MKILINDANIIFDLCNANAFQYIFNLPYEIHTVDFVVTEIKQQEQQEQVTQAIKQGKLKVKKFSPTEMIELFNLKDKESHKLTINDVSVIYYAMQTPESVILTGDKKLRQSAQKHRIQTFGILFVIDKYVDMNIISNDEAIKILYDLIKTNKWLPKEDINSRIKHLKNHT